MQHFGSVIACSASGYRLCANQPREADAAKIYRILGRIRCQLAVVISVIATQMFAVKFIDAVHGLGLQVRILLNLARRVFGGDIGQPIGRN